MRLTFFLSESTFKFQEICIQTK